MAANGLKRLQKEYKELLEKPEILANAVVEPNGENMY